MGLAETTQKAADRCGACDASVWCRMGAGGSTKSGVYIVGEFGYDLDFEARTVTLLFGSQRGRVARIEEDEAGQLHFQSPPAQRVYLTVIDDDSVRVHPSLDAPGRLFRRAVGTREPLRPDVVYAYIDGNDLDGSEAHIEAQIAHFIASRSWVFGAPWAVNQRHEPDETRGPDDLPDWDVGLNLKYPDPAAPPPAGWLDDLMTILEFLERLARQANRDFVVGFSDVRRSATRDVLFIGTKPVSRRQVVEGLGWPFS